MRIHEGDIVNYKHQPRTLLAGQTGVCRINSFERSRNGMVVYIDQQLVDGSFFEKFSRHWPLEIAFAPLGSEQYGVYVG
jgi:hypothetical protein